MFATETWLVNYKARMYWFQILLAFQIWYGKHDLQFEFGNDLTLHLLLKVTSKSYFEIEFAFDFRFNQEWKWHLCVYFLLPYFNMTILNQPTPPIFEVFITYQSVNSPACFECYQFFNLFIFKSYFCSFIVLFNFLVIIVIISQTPRQMVILFSV